MNFISHFFFDRNLDDSIFVVGACTPDLLSVFDRSAKLKEREVEQRVRIRPMTADEKSFYRGVRRHFQLDKHFHSSQFFHDETLLLAELLRDSFKDQELQRSFFVAHILLELLLDKLLIQEDEGLLIGFYRHLRDRRITELATLTEWIAGRELPRYHAFLNRFISEQHLFHYRELPYVVRVLKRILERVGIQRYPYLEQAAFLGFLGHYERDLQARHPRVLDELNASLHPVSDK